MTFMFRSVTAGLVATSPTLFTLLVVYGAMGFEYSWQNMAFARTGMHLGHDTAGMSAGAGVRLRLGKMMAVVDYAFVDYDILRMTHQVALGIEF